MAAVATLRLGGGVEAVKAEASLPHSKGEQRLWRLGVSGFWGDGQVLHGVVGFNEAAEAFHDSWTVEKFAEEFDFFAEFLVGDGLDELFGGDAGFGVELGDLLGHGTRDL